MPSGDEVAFERAIFEAGTEGVELLGESNIFRPGEDEISSRGVRGRTEEEDGKTEGIVVKVRRADIGGRSDRCRFESPVEREDDGALLCGVS